MPDVKKIAFFGSIVFAVLFINIFLLKPESYNVEAHINDETFNLNEFQQASLEKPVKDQIHTADYEIFGKVQGVYFRKYTQIQGQKLGLVGWVMNTPQGTVVGTMQGHLDNIIQMKTWLCNQGSPQSKIKQCVFKNEGTLDEAGYKSFEVRK